MFMPNPHVLSPGIIDRLAHQALNELSGYLCEGDPYRDNGAEWPSIARNIAVQCRAVALAAGDGNERDTWLNLAHQYEGTIRPEDREVGD
jgi:hypothetical protein